GRAGAEPAGDAAGRAAPARRRRRLRPGRVRQRGRRHPRAGDRRRPAGAAGGAVLAARTPLAGEDHRVWRNRAVRRDPPGAQWRGTPARGRHPRFQARHRAEGERADVGFVQGTGGDRRRAARRRPRRPVGAAPAPRPCPVGAAEAAIVLRRQRRSYNVPMKAPVDVIGSLKYLLLRPFLRQAWARHRDTGLVYRVNLRDVVGRTILRRRAYEPDLTAWLLRELGVISQ